MEDTVIIPRLQEYANGRVVEIVRFPEQKHTTTIQWEESLLREAEILCACTHTQTGTQWLNLMRDHDHTTTVLLVGAGIMNLMTAEFQLRVVTRCASWMRAQTFNPVRTRLAWASLTVVAMPACSLIEADNYNEKGSKIYQNMQSIFRQTIRNGGWGVKSPKNFTSAELPWVNTFEQVPAWLA